MLIADLGLALRSGPAWRVRSPAEMPTTLLDLAYPIFCTREIVSVARRVL
jgi:hypothetical protein